jgi:branched-chain amino acid transport system substrate-binding protein
LLPQEGQHFVERYQERFPESNVEAFDAYAFEATNVLLDAIERAYENDGEVTREGVVQELVATQNYDGVLGTWSFDENGDTTLTQLTGDIVQDGKLGVDRDKLDVATVATT